MSKLHLSVTQDEQIRSWNDYQGQVSLATLRKPWYDMHRNIMALERGTRIGPYEIAEIIGVGGMGDQNGKRILETLIWKSIEDVAWRNDSEIWFGASKEERSLWLHAVDLKGHTRVAATSNPEADPST